MLTTLSLISALLLRTASVDDVFGVSGIYPLRSSIAEAERILGPGAQITGGHPHSGRVWRLSAKSHWLLYADGFDPVNRRGDQSYLITEFAIEPYNKHFSHLP
ncbi:MAG: hypothetical protein P4L46_05210, partial [Fimbriimonas sp.]|nr:hypothetical protein [Fimbriimonas sp.]